MASDLAYGAEWLTVTLSEESGAVSASDAPLRSPTPLYAEQYLSLPPVDAVFQLGSGKVERFLSQHRWPRNEHSTTTFQAKQLTITKPFGSATARHFRKDIAAVLGGWNMP
jgi:hypothetical protein